MQVRSQNGQIFIQFVHFLNGLVIDKDSLSREVNLSISGTATIQSPTLRELKCSSLVKRIEFETDPRVVNVQFEFCEPCTIVFKPEFTITKGKMHKTEFKTAWEKYMQGEIDLKEFYPFEEEK